MWDFSDSFVLFSDTTYFFDGSGPNQPNPGGGIEMATNGLEIIKGALRRINSYQSGETIAAPDANDALVVLNDMLESWSTQQAFVYGSLENVLQWTTGKNIYTIGPGGDFSVDSATNAAVSRPLRITGAYTRIPSSGGTLDYPMEIVDQGRYIAIGVKSVPAPWPIMLWYNPTAPLGTIYVYQTPSQAGELHLFTDTILSTFANLTTLISLPQGYTRALKMGLARELSLEYGYPLTPALEKLAQEAMTTIKSLNQQPVPVSNYDSAIVRSRATDASWILHGGFNS